MHVTPCCSFGTLVVLPNVLSVIRLVIVHDLLAIVHNFFEIDERISRRFLRKTAGTKIHAGASTPEKSLPHALLTQSNGTLTTRNHG